MNLTIWNILSQKSAATEETPLAMLIFMCAGGAIFLGWFIACLKSKDKFKMSDSPGRETLLNPFIAAGILLCYLIITGVIVSGGLAFAGSDSLELASILSITASVVVIFGLIFTARYLFANKLAGFGLDFSKTGRDILRGVLAFAAVYPLVFLTAELTKFALIYINNTWGTDFSFQVHGTVTAIKQGGAWLKILSAILAAVCAPILEELLYRGIVQSSLRRYMGPWSAVSITSILFCLMHADVTHWPALFVLSTCLGYNYEKTGRLLPSIIVHFLFNGLTVSLVIFS